MKIIELQENLYLYHIPNVDKNKLGINIYALVDGHNALLIDTGFRNDFAQVIEDLKNKKINIVQVVPSHYHPDHIDGLCLLTDPKVYGNQHAQKTVEIFYEKANLNVFLPTIIINQDYKINFGEFEITFEYAPGHSDCSMLININNTYLHVGDLYMKTDSNDEVLPSLAWDGVQNHIDSLDKINAHKDKTFLISHGVCPCEYDEVEPGIENRKEYLYRLLESNNKISVEEAVKNCTKPFQFMQWRDYVK